MMMMMMKKTVEVINCYLQEDSVLDIPVGWEGNLGSSNYGLVIKEVKPNQ